MIRIEPRLGNAQTADISGLDNISIHYREEEVTDMNHLQAFENAVIVRNVVARAKEAKIFPSDDALKAYLHECSKVSLTKSVSNIRTLLY